MILSTSLNSNSYSFIDKLRAVDYFLIIIVAIIGSLSVFSIYSTESGNFSFYTKNHLIRFLVFFSMFLILSFIRVSAWYRQAYIFYILGILLLLFVMFFGVSASGSKRWINLFIMNLQPSELMKIAVIVCFARYYHRIQSSDIQSYKYLLQPIILLLIAEPLRNLGKYSFADVVSFRLNQRPIRILAACGSLSTVILYLIAQMVGAGKLIEILFGLPYYSAVIIVGGLMILYVTFGGMLATTWVQIIKAILLLFGATVIAMLVLFQFNFDLNLFFNEATSIHKKGINILSPGGLISDPISAVSLGLALMFGTAGLPHILMRFFTVPDAKSARISAVYATTFIGYFYILTLFS